MQTTAAELKRKTKAGAARVAFALVAALAFLVLLVNIFLPIDRVERAAQRMVRWARERPFIRRGFEG